MSNVRFSRDEIILALDVLYSAGEQRLNPQSPSVIALSELLNELPIHKSNVKKNNFRTPSGVLKQLKLFEKSYVKCIKNADVGSKFYEIASEFENRREELHAIACAIKRNIDSYDMITFGNEIESNSFPEGALLGHLHCILEKRDGAGIKADSQCMVCGINTKEIYRGGLDLVTLHLTVPIADINWKKRYTAEDFISVCPNCHAALHRTRPWLMKEFCEKILD